MSITWSPSAILSARACLLQWHLTYGAGRIRGGQRVIRRHQALGTALHAALETAYKAARDDRHRSLTFMSVYLDQAVEALADSWRALRLPEDDALQADLVAELGRVLGSAFAPHPAAILAVEEKIDFFGPSGTPFTVRLDLALRTGPHSIHLRDWKRARLSSLPSPDDLLDDVQMCQQRCAADVRWPWVRTVTVGLYSTRSDAEVRVEMPLARALYRLEGHEMTAHQAESATAFPPSPGAACDGCHVRPQCPVFGGV